MSLDNRRRAFSDAVTVDAWHRPFDGERRTASLHAHVAFGEARVGHEPGMRISFRLGLRRAEVVVAIGEGEGLQVERKSVARKSSGSSFQGTEVRQDHSLAAIGGRISLMIGLDALRSAAGGGMTAKRSKGVKRRSITKTKSAMRISQSMTSNDEYRWVIESQSDSVLNGEPWDAAKDPRLTLIDPSVGKPRQIEPCVRIEVRCRREDLVVSDIEIIDKQILKDIPTGTARSRRNEVAAECYIRDELMRRGLGAVDLSNRFAEVTILSVTAEQS